MDARLAIVDVLDADGRWLRSVDVAAWPLRFGRALSNDLVLDDPHVAADHGRLIDEGQGQLLLEVGDTLNGVQIGRRIHPRGERVPLASGQGITLQVGGHQLRIRSAHAPLAAEEPLTHRTWSQRLPWGSLLALAGLAGAQVWLNADPGEVGLRWLPAALAWGGGLLGWAALWALASKLFHRGFDFTGHLRIAATTLLAAELCDALTPLLAAAFDWPWLWQMGHWLPLLWLAVLLTRHLMHVLPQRRRSLRATGIAFTAAAIALQAGLAHSRTDRWWPGLYMTALPPAAMRWHSSSSIADLLGDVRKLQPALDEAAREQPDAADDIADDEAQE